MICEVETKGTYVLCYLEKPYLTQVNLIQPNTTLTNTNGSCSHVTRYYCYHYYSMWLRVRIYVHVCQWAYLCMYVHAHRGQKRVSGAPPITLCPFILRQGLFLNLGLRFSQVSWKPAQPDKPHISIPPVTCYMGVGI